MRGHRAVLILASVLALVGAWRMRSAGTADGRKAVAPGDLRPAVVAADGNTIGIRDGTVYDVDRATGSAREIGPAAGARGIAVSPAGRIAIVGDDGQVSVLRRHHDPRAAGPSIIPIDGGAAGPLAFLADGRLLVADTRGGLVVVEPSGAQRTYPAHVRPITRIETDRAGDRFVTVSDGATRQWSSVDLSHRGALAPSDASAP